MSRPALPHGANWDDVMEATWKPVGDPPADGLDLVNHPPHYGAHPSGVECITITEHMNFNLGNAMKYLWRVDSKGDAVANLRKAAWYVAREIQRREKYGNSHNTGGGIRLPEEP